MTPDEPGGATAIHPEAKRQLPQRSRDAKMIAGVCGGLGRFTGLDPLLFRIALVVLAFFGGVGCILYLAGWLFLPEDGDTSSPVEALFGRGRSSTSTVTTVVLLVIGVVGATKALDSRDSVLLALALAGCFYLTRQHRGHPVAPLTGSSTPVSTATVPLPYAPHGPYVDPYTAGYVPPPAPAVRAPRKRSRLGRIVLSGVLVILGILAALDRLGAIGIGPSGYLAAALTVVGAGLLVGAWYGRSRGLLVLGLLLSLALAASTAITHLAGSSKGTSVRAWTPTSAADVRPAYELGVGKATLDLHRVNFTEAPPVTTHVHVGFGRLIIDVPPTVDVTVRAKATAGHLSLFGANLDGTGLDRTLTDTGADGTGGGSLQLIIDNGVGDVEVTRD